MTIFRFFNMNLSEKRVSGHCRQWQHQGWMLSTKMTGNCNNDPLTCGRVLHDGYSLWSPSVQGAGDVDHNTCVSWMSGGLSIMTSLAYKKIKNIKTKHMSGRNTNVPVCPQDIRDSLNSIHDIYRSKVLIGRPLDVRIDIRKWHI